MSAPKSHDSFQGAMRYVTEYLVKRQGGGTFTLSPGPVGKFALVTCARTAVKVGGGLVITLGLDREQVQSLRDMCDELLKGSGAS